MDYINVLLEDLEDDQFKKFQRFLRDPAYLDGQEPIGRALLQNKDRMETADVMVETYPDNVDRIMMNLLGKVGRKDLLKKYEDKVQSKAVAASVPAPAPAPAPAPTPTVAAESDPRIQFVTKHRRALIQRVTMVAPILDLLVEERIMQNEDYSNVRAERTAQGKMRELFVLLDSRGARAKRAFYKGLEENEPCLIEDLNDPQG